MTLCLSFFFFLQSFRSLVSNKPKNVYIAVTFDQVALSSAAVYFVHHWPAAGKTTNNSGGGANYFTQSYVPVQCALRGFYAQSLLKLFAECCLCWRVCRTDQRPKVHSVQGNRDTILSLCCHWQQDDFIPTKTPTFTSTWECKRSHMLCTHSSFLLAKMMCLLMTENDF